MIVISLGYGKNGGFPHESKDISQLYKADEEGDWFMKVIIAASLAPTALNQQNSGKVILKNLGGPYSKIDLGIAKCHFEVSHHHEIEEKDE